MLQRGLDSVGKGLHYFQLQVTLKEHDPGQVILQMCCQIRPAGSFRLHRLLFPGSGTEKNGYGQMIWVEFVDDRQVVLKRYILDACLRPVVAVHLPRRLDLKFAVP